ncbi:hypothetical protein SAMN04487926_1357 [Paraburkholderia steynii]|uniref:Uncharacterized protein n=1 Tax=Paraburkholderia steynii TaxID=1245441 RepID=A0A7Z7FNN9_9BURK|nr:hypothetical protein [Paraburkholderia steynii]SDJ14747.1 hypothetical protein SAMN04487926_1357 [Paraburkholderia steynii]
MYVDPRVALGRTQFELGSVTQFLDISCRQRILDAVVKAVGNPNITNREYRRRLQKNAIPALRRANVLAYYQQHEEFTGLIVHYTTVGDDGIARRLLLWSHADRTAIGSVPVCVEPHAVARCMQRNGVMSVGSILPEILQAFNLAPYFFEFAWKSGWKQIGIPTSSGLFVGELQNEVDIVLKTYFKPGANGRVSRWSPYIEYFRDLVDAANREDAPGDEMQNLQDLKLAATDNGRGVAARFSFLTEPYVYQHDRDTALWDQARALAVG